MNYSRYFLGTTDRTRWHWTGRLQSGLLDAQQPRKSVGGERRFWRGQRSYWQPYDKSQQLPRTHTHYAQPPDATIGLPASVLSATVPSLDAESSAAAESQHTGVFERRSLWAAALIAASHAPASLQPVGRSATVSSGSIGNSSVAP